MIDLRRKGILAIRKSCITGQAVWVYKGPTKRSVLLAYYRACRREVERVRCWPAIVARRRENVLRMLSDCLAGVPAVGDLPPEKKAAAKRLLALSEEKGSGRSAFYEHFMEERRRRSSGKSTNQ